MCKNCICHKYFWLDLCRIDECDCKGTAKRYYSNHNYIFDIPLDKLFELANNINLIEMSKSFKLKSGKFSEVGSTEMLSISDLKGKLFLYFKMLVSGVKVDCPSKGNRCEFNKTNKAFYLANTPLYLTFSLQKNVRDDKLFSLSTVTETLKTFVLIPKIFDLGTLFDHSSKQKMFFEFFGAILIKPAKNFCCFFKNQNINKSPGNNDYLWIHYDEDKTTTFTSQFELISYCLKNSEFPVLLFYQIQEKYSDIEKDLTADELQMLEKYAKHADNLFNIIGNRFRSNEDIIKFENVKEGANRPNSKVGQYSSKNTSISTSKPDSTNNSNSRIEGLNEYSCINCHTKNRIEIPICPKCNKNNEAFIEDLLKKRGMNYINIANFNLNINTAMDMKENTNSYTNNSTLKEREKEREKDVKGNSINKAKNPSLKNISNPYQTIEKDKRISNLLENSEEDDIVNNGNCKKNYNMPKQIVTKKENPVIVRNVLTENNDIYTHSKQPSQFSKKNLVSVTPINDKTPTRNGKKTTSLDDKVNTYEDRVQQTDIIRSKSKKTLSKASLYIPDSWSCDYCLTVNKAYEHKCHECKRIYSKDTLSNVVSPLGNQNKMMQPSAHFNTNTHYNTVKSPNKEIKITQKSEKRPSSSNFSTLDKKSCICFANYNESIIKNNICTLCNRYVENTNNYENYIKKRYQQESAGNLNSNRAHTPSNNTAARNTINTKSQDKAKKEECPQILTKDKDMLTKFRSPSSLGGIRPKSNAAINRYKDLNNNDEEMFSNNKEISPGIINKNKNNDSQYRNTNSTTVGVNRLNNTKKKSESISQINQNNTNPSNLMKTRK